MTAAICPPQGPCPVHMAITGHRDIPAGSEAGIRQHLRQALQSQFVDAYPATPIKLLTGLAEGADRLAAEVALELGMGLIAVLPLPQSDYETDFSTPESLAQFRSLLARCETITTAAQAPGAARDAGYVAQGVFMVENAQVLWALWDGYGLEDKANIAPGGTADVVRMALEGTPVHTADGTLVAKHATWVWHVPTPRVRNSEAKNSAMPLLAQTTQAAIRTQTQQMLTHINRFNQAAVQELAYAAGQSVPAALQQSLDWLLGSALAAAQPHSALLRVYAVADTLAGTRQRKRTESIQTVTALALLSILCQQIYSGPDMALPWLALHMGFAGAAFYFYKRFFAGQSQHEAQYLEWRVLAESLRVQIFWKLAGIATPAHTVYFTNRPAEVEWIVQTLVNLNTAYAGAAQHAAPSPNLVAVQTHWMANQADYFTGKQNKAALNAGQAQRFARRVRWTFAAALAFTAVTLVGHALGADPEWLNLCVLASGMAFVAAAVLGTYADQMGFDENAKRYDSMGRLFQFSKTCIAQALATGDAQTAHLVIHHLGLQAIQENLSWFQQHRMNAYKVQVA